MGIIVVIVVLIIVFVAYFSEKDRKHREEEAAKRADLEKRMAVLREIKADKARRAAAAAEKARLDAEKKKEEREKYLVEQERKDKELTEKLEALLKHIGVKLDNCDSAFGEYFFSVDDMNVDLSAFWKSIDELGLGNESIRLFINSSSGRRLACYINPESGSYAVSMGRGSVIKLNNEYELHSYASSFCKKECQLNALRDIDSVLALGVDNAHRLESQKKQIDEYLSDLLSKSQYSGLFDIHAKVYYENSIALVEYELPSKDDIPWVKDYHYNKAGNRFEEIHMAESTIATTYENLLYSICLRSIYELCVSKRADEIKAIVFNGFVSAINRSNGIKERNCILSLQVSKEKFLALDLKNVEPKKCFKALRGVSAAKLIDISPVQPVLAFNKDDKRFIAGKDIKMNSGTNLASMDWEDFEHLVRELFELEFARNGGEVRVTQASRDGGVDAVVFDPDPLRGGKIVIQAKRYTNTVGVSAVRDLYGTVINEGANTGILITTSDYGHDSYEFAKDKPIKLLNGGHLLALLHKNGKEGYINIEEAKITMKENQ